MATLPYLPFARPTLDEATRNATMVAAAPGCVAATTSLETRAAELGCP